MRLKFALTVKNKKALASTGLKDDFLLQGEKRHYTVVAKATLRGDIRVVFDEFLELASANLSTPDCI